MALLALKAEKTNEGEMPKHLTPVAFRYLHTE